MTEASSPDVVLDVRGLTISFVEADGSLDVLDNLSFQVEENSFVCLIGPSGGGKSTLLRAIGGLLLPTSGEILFPRHQQNSSLTGMVFQKPNLMPWRSVLENILLPLEIQGLEKEAALDKARQMVELVGLQGFEASLPRDLSGGMAQRVAIARALVQDPGLLLLDEPFGSLDALTRERMGDELLRIWQARRKTVLMVTHSISESLFLADRVLVLSPRPGRLRLDLAVNLPRPRLAEMRYSPAFADLARQVRAAIE